MSNAPEAYGLVRAEKAGISCAVLDHREFSGREAFDRELIRVLKNAGVDLVVLAGFMRILGGEFLRTFDQRIINIHPALLPAFPGTHVQQKALDYGVKFSGCTVHFVDEGVDTGPIIIQAVVPVLPGDTAVPCLPIPEEKHKIYPHAIRYFAKPHSQKRRHEEIAASAAIRTLSCTSALVRITGVDRAFGRKPFAHV